MQLIYKGKTSRYNPNYSFLEGFNITHKKYHWYEAKFLEMIDKNHPAVCKKVDHILKITEKSGVASHS